MSWIKENQFTAGLAAVTLVGVAGLYYWGSGSQEKTAQALQDFQAAASEITRYEGGRLYPSDTNRDLKRKAVADYSAQAGELRDRMVHYGPKAGQPAMASNAFGTELQAANARVRAAFEASQTTLPSSFLLGFEGYANTIAHSDATNLLAYQVGAMEWMFVKLADARPKALLNVYRKPLPEEKGQAYEYQAGQVSRDLAFEVTFSGSARAMREFLGSLVDSKEYYFIPRVIRVENEKQVGPSRNDAEFKTSSAAKLPDEFDPGVLAFTDVKPAGEEGVDPAAEPIAGEEADATASEEILKQVLGDEAVKVFLRIDLRLFRDAASVPLPELPKSL